MEAGELLEDTLCREFKEETGMTVTSYHQLGTINFLYPWRYKETTMNNHICVFYEIRAIVGKLEKNVHQFTGQDSLGAVFFPIEQLNEQNASPLVIKACEVFKQEAFTAKSQRLMKWDVLEAPSYE